MIAELGHFALILATCIALIQALVPVAGARSGDGRLMAVADTTALAQLLFVGLSFAALTMAY
ncbi:MAG: hypothetical protein KDJ36_19505, partial [Hyphomicrobiaceae bacterium]|nr:hypothetical protein [Hyphomicrobiaceae bacterium]